MVTDMVKYKSGTFHIHRWLKLLYERNGNPLFLFFLQVDGSFFFQFFSVSRVQRRGHRQDTKALNQLLLNP